jgi:hypothetical protein
MAGIDYNQIVSDCVSSAKQIAGNTWNSLKPYAEHEFRQFAENAEFLAKLRATNNISEEEFKSRIDIQRLSLRNVLLTVEGIGLVAAQNIVNAVLSIVFTAIKSVIQIPFPL